MTGVGTARLRGLADVAWGGLLLLGTGPTWRRVTGRPPSAPERQVVAVLGARHLGQGLVELLAPTRVPWLWAATDLAHAVSMAAVALLDPVRRRPALVSGAVSALGALASATVRPRPPAPAAVLVPSRRARRPGR